MYVSVPVQGEISTACGGQKFNDTMVRNKQFHISISGQMVCWLAGIYVSVLHILSLCKADFLDVVVLRPENPRKQMAKYAVRLQ